MNEMRSQINDLKYFVAKTVSLILLLLAVCSEVYIAGLLGPSNFVTTFFLSLLLIPICMGVLFLAVYTTDLTGKFFVLEEYSCLSVAAPFMFYGLSVTQFIIVLIIGFWRLISPIF
jgi:hypothetical protein